MDIDTILNWVRQNPMNTEFMLLEIIKGFGVKAEINGGLIFINIEDPQDNKYVSVLVTNRAGDDIISHKGIKINREAKLNFVALNHKGCICYSLLLPSENPNLLSIPELSLLEDGDYLIYSDKVLVSKISSELEIEAMDKKKDSKKNVKNKTSV